MHAYPHSWRAALRGAAVSIADAVLHRASRPARAGAPDTLRLAAGLVHDDRLLEAISRHTIFSVTDRAGRIIDVNDGFCRISGYERENLIGRTHQVINSGHHPRAFWTEMWRTIGRGEPWRGEVCNRARDGSYYWVDSIIAPVDPGLGQPGRYVSIRIDITARKAIEEELKNANERFDIASVPAGLGVWEWDVGADRLDWDDQMYKLHRRERTHGLRPLSFWTETLVQEDQSRCKDALVRLLRGDRDFDHELRVRWPNGEIRYHKVTARVIAEAGGDARRVTGITVDVTERKRAELELQATTSLLRTVLDSASEVSLIATDPDLVITVFNRGAERMLGHAAADLVGSATPLAIHDHLEVRTRARELGAQRGYVVRGRDVFIDASMLDKPFEWSYVTSDGARLRVLQVVTAMRREDGSLLGYLFAAHDVSRQKEIEDYLRDARAKAEHASNAKSHFLANVSHEIRTPLSAIIGLSHLVRQTPLDAEQADLLTRLSHASNSLLGVVNDVLDLSKIEAGELALESVPFQLRELLDELAAVMSPQAQAKGIALEMRLPETLPAVLKGDPVRLRQVLSNLVSNAIKFTERGSVAVRVHVVDATEERATLRFVVHDTGVGMDLKGQMRLFTPFAQADTSTTRRYGGTGLGLSIVKNLVEMMGGRVWVRSTPGVGSTFSVQARFERPRDAEVLEANERPREHEDLDLEGVRVLVVDDCEVNRVVASRVLQHAGATVVTAHDGNEALEYLRAHASGIDAVLMDVQMPVLDGLEATRRLRTDLGLTALPVIALTAGALTSERTRARAAGMDDFIGKPFEVHDLIRTVRRRTRGEPAGRAPVALPVRPTAWPRIDGIDGADAAERLGNDAVLFRHLLQRLLDEYTDAALPHGPYSEDAFALHADRLHKLRGAAGTLGAGPLRQLAEDAETAARSADGLRLAAAVQALGAALELLRESSAAFLQGAPLAPAPHTLGVRASALDANAVAEFIALLRDQNLAAVDRLAGMAQPLRRRLGDEVYDRLDACMKDLRFAEAAALLEPLAR